MIKKLNQACYGFKGGAKLPQEYLVLTPFNKPREFLRRLILKEEKN